MATLLLLLLWSVGHGDAERRRGVAVELVIEEDTFLNAVQIQLRMHILHLKITRSQKSSTEIRTRLAYNHGSQID